MVWILYNILFSFGFLVMLPRFLGRMMRRGGYARDFSQRLGRYSDAVLEKLEGGGRVWIHAVSVGEMFIALRLMREWRERCPGTKFVVTTTTSTGHAVALKEVKDPDVVLYFPVDFPWISRRVLEAIDPKALILVELELWPNLVRHAHARGIPVALVNGRVSDHSFDGYRKLTLFTRRVLPLLQILCVQTEADGERLVALGADPERVKVMGSAKYDVAAREDGGEARALQVLRDAGVQEGDPVLLGGSTWPGEEGMLLDAFKALRTSNPRLMLVLAPRHVERARDVLKDIADRGLSVARRTEIKASLPKRPAVLLVDTTGELKNFYACADVIFVGKSLTQHGGQNVIEPALYAKAIVVGPNMENFRGVVEDFLAARALVQVNDQGHLRQALGSLFKDAAARQAMGTRAADLVREKAGALGKTLEALEAAAILDARC
ncbi:MAG TPA: 3-deoxy-D-manno-octulosonic acid transferase [Kiritimatiellia bacterium]|jgi:3-deoxy-D-manno-octulosonic-acid transferase